MLSLGLIEAATSGRRLTDAERLIEQAKVAWRGPDGRAKLLLLHVPVDLGGETN
jgi:hypothetical protein